MADYNLAGLSLDALGGINIMVGDRFCFQYLSYSRRLVCPTGDRYSPMFRDDISGCHNLEKVLLGI